MLVVSICFSLAYHGIERKVTKLSAAFVSTWPLLYQWVMAVVWSRKWMPIIAGLFIAWMVAYWYLMSKPGQWTASQAYLMTHIWREESQAIPV